MGIIWLMIIIAVSIFVFTCLLALDEAGSLFSWHKKRQARKELRNSSYQNTAGIFVDVLNSTKKDWSYDEVKGSMKFTLSNHFTVRFGKPSSDRYGYINIYYKEVRVLRLRVETNVLRVFRFRVETNVLRYGSEENLPTILVDETLSHLISINEQFSKENKEKKQEEAKIKERLLIKQKAEEEELEKIFHLKKVAQLKKLLAEAKPFENVEKINLKLAVTSISCEVSYRGTVFFEAFYNKKTGKITTNFLNEHDEDANIFRLTENELMKFVYTMFSDQKLETDELKLDEELVVTIEQKVQCVLEKVDRLSMEGKWLDIESKHQLEKTIPNDVKDLLNLYNEMEDKTKVKAKFMDSIHQIEEQLHEMKEKIEENKQFKFEQKTTVIEKRIMSKK